MDFLRMVLRGGGLKILLLTTYYYDDPTYRTVLEGLAKAYAKLGHNVDTVGRLAPDSSLPGRQVKPWGSSRRLKGGAVCAFFRLLPMTAAADLVHWHLGSERQAHAWAVRLACALAGTPCIVTLHSHRNPHVEAGAGWGRRALGLLLGAAHWVTVPSESAARSVLSEHPALAGRLRVIPNGFDFEEAEAVPAPPPPARPFVLSLARQHPYKGTDLLLMAWKDCCADFPEVELVFCGGAKDESYPKLARLLGISERVRFTGLADRAEALRLLKSCSFLALPSRYESFGLAALEAMACGKAVLATRCGGPEEFIEDEVSGLLAPVADVAALERGLRRLLSDEALRSRLGAAARAASRVYTWDRAAAGFCGLEAGRGAWTAAKPLLAAVVLSLLLVEGLARAYTAVFPLYHVEMSRYASELKINSANPSIAHVHVPGVKTTLMGVPVEINADGFRDKDYSPERGARRRFVFLGDSLTFGWGVRKEETFESLLEKELDAEILNLGAGNYNTEQEAALFAEKGLKYRPDAVFVFYFINDAEPLPRRSAWSPLTASRLATVYRSGAEALLTRLRPARGYLPYYRSLYSEQAEGWLRTREAFSRLKSLCDRNRIALRVVLLPELHVLSEYPFRAEHETVAAFLKSKGITHLDLAPLFPPLADPRGLWVARDDAHPNARAHRLIAELSRSFVSGAAR